MAVPLAGGVRLEAQRPGVLEYLLKPSLLEYDYVYFMLNDFPEFATSILNLMSDPDNIEYVCIGFNDYYKLTDEDKDIDKDDIEKYLELVSEYMMTTTILRKGVEIPNNKLRVMPNRGTHSAYQRPVMVSNPQIEKLVRDITNISSTPANTKNALKYKASRQRLTKA